MGANTENYGCFVGIFISKNVSSGVLLCTTYSDLYWQTLKLTMNWNCSVLPLKKVAKEKQCQWRLFPKWEDAAGEEIQIQL